MTVPLRNFAASLLCSLAVLSAEEKQAAIVLPAEFALPSPPVADEENGLLLFLKEFEDPTIEEFESYQNLLEAMRTGNAVPDPEFLQRVRQIHEDAKRRLKAPAAFATPNDRDQPHAPLLRLFHGAEILFRHSRGEPHPTSADRYLVDALQWSRVLRNAYPNSTEANISDYGWRSVIELFLEDWQDSENQKTRFEDLLRVFESNRVEVEEVISIAKADARRRVEQGGKRAVLKQMEATRSKRFGFNDRFGDVPLSDLLSLPYDREADFQRFFEELSGQIRGLRQDIPAVRWPGVSKPVVNRTFEDYRKLPNGLSDFLSEQTDLPWAGPSWLAPLCRQRLLDACLIWLKRERGRLDVTADSFKTVKDPISGQAFAIDLERRMIRCPGWDGKAAPLDPDELKPGFHDEEDDYVLVVPTWKERK